MNRVTPWTDQEIAQAAEIQRSDVARALALIAEASPELAEMVQATEEAPTQLS